PLVAESTSGRAESAAESIAESTAESAADRRILEINFEKSPSEFNYSIENPSKINLLEINFGKSPVWDCFLNVLSHLGYEWMSADDARSHGGDDGGEDRPLHTMYPAVAWVALLIEAKANKSPIWAVGQRAG
nr:hypothetical protein [Tanacetum cinerariifolium]